MTLNLQKMQRISELSSTLSESTDDLNALIDSLNEKLSSMNIGVSVWHDQPLLDRNEVGDFIEGYELGYAKASGNWCICVRFVHFKYFNEEGDFCISNRVVKQPISLMKASRKVRLEAIGAINDLFDLLEKQIEEYIGDVEDAKEAFRVR